MSNSYYSEVKISYPREEILSLVQEFDSSTWHQGQCKNGIYWPVDECRKMPPNPIWDDLIAFINSPSKPLQLNDNIFISSVHPGGLPCHSDGVRLCALNFPLNSEPSETIFVDGFDNVLERFSIPNNDSYTPVLINTQQKHGVILPKDTKKKRYILSVSLYESYNEILKKIKNGELFNSNNRFKLS